MSSEKKVDWMVPGYPVLSGEVGTAAVQGKIVSFPQVVRSNKDFPVPQQSMGMISFQFFDEPKKLASGRSVYGFFKLRGNYSDENMCKTKATDIICNQDSRNKIKIAEVGAWLPITDEEGGGIVKETVNVNVDASEQDKLREAAILEERKKAERVVREIRDREEEVKNGKDYNDEPDSLDYYTMKRVTWLRLEEQLELLKSQIVSIETKRTDTRALLAGMEKDHPDYSANWIENYNVERRKAGIPDYIPSEKQEGLYNLTA